MRERGIADLLRALTLTPPDRWAAVVGVLGFAWVPDVLPAVDSDAVQPPAPARIEGAVMPPVTALVVGRAEEELPRRAAVPAGTEPAADIPWLNVPTLPRPSVGRPRPRPPDPLLTPRRRAAVLTALCDTRRPTGRIDVTETVRLIARLQPVRRLPRRCRTTLARGVQVLVDEGEGLQPFAADAADVAAGLRAVLGEHLVQDGWFLDDPRYGVAFGDDDVLRPFRPPAPGTPVLLLTDLGIGGGGNRRRWPRKASLLTLGRRLAAQQSPLVALVPYPSARWPAGLDRWIGLVFWDRRATVSKVRQARRRTEAVR